MATNQSVDLDINNYNLDDLLKLFNMPMNFDETHLKEAKKMVMRTHPDKSQLPADYFRFYAKAYKTIFSLWEFRNKGGSEKINQSTEYVTIAEHDEKGRQLGAFFEKNKELKKYDKFNEWFNKQFMENKIKNDGEDKGYNDWLRGDDDITPDDGPKTLSEMDEAITKRKSALRDKAMVVHQDVQDIWGFNSINASDLSGQAPSSFDSDMFSSLPFQDLQKAHNESVIPVTNQDYENKQQFKSVTDYMMYRGQQDTKPLSEKQALNYLKNRDTIEEKTATQRAYHLAKQTEEAEENNKKFWSNILSLTDK